MLNITGMYGFKNQTEILNLLLELESVFDDAVRIICEGTMPKTIDASFWVYYKEKNLATYYPHSTFIIVTKILNESCIEEYNKPYISEIVKDIYGLNTREANALKEALLKKNIQI